MFARYADIPLASAALRAIWSNEPCADSRRWRSFMVYFRLAASEQHRGPWSIYMYQGRGILAHSSTVCSQIHTLPYPGKSRTALLVPRPQRRMFNQTRSRSCSALDYQYMKAMRQSISGRHSSMEHLRTRMHERCNISFTGSKMRYTKVECFNFAHGSTEPQPINIGTHLIECRWFPLPVYGIGQAYTLQRL